MDARVAAGDKGRSVEHIAGTRIPAGSVRRAPFDLRLVEPFVVLAEEDLHFPRAAERLGIGASGLSRQIARLQRELNATLIGLDGRTHVLTPAGERFLVHARGIRARLLAVHQDDAESMHHDLRIHLGLSTPRSVETAISELMLENPTVEIRISQQQDCDPVEELLAGAADIVVNLRSALPHDAEFALLETARLGVLTTGAHPIALRGVITWQELQDGPVLITTSKAATHWNAMLQGCFNDSGVSIHAIAGSPVNPPQYMLPAIRRGDALLIRPLLSGEPAPAGLAWTPLVPERVVDLGLIWLPERAGSCVQHFIDFTLERGAEP